MDQGAAYNITCPMKHQILHIFFLWFIKLIATIFCAAAVFLIPIFQIDTACTEVIINKDANLLSLKL